MLPCIINEGSSYFSLESLNEIASIISCYSFWRKSTQCFSMLSKTLIFLVTIFFLIYKKIW